MSSFGNFPSSVPNNKASAFRSAHGLTATGQTGILLSARCEIRARNCSWELGVGLAKFFLVSFTGEESGEKCGAFLFADFAHEV